MCTLAIDSLVGKPLYQRMKCHGYEAIIQTAMRECGVKTRKRADELLDAFLQWFALIPLASPEHPLQMARSVDRIWHAMVLNTVFYRDFCRRFAGSFIDHNPLDVESNSQEQKQEYAQYTLALLAEEFGTEVSLDLLDMTQDITCCIGCG